MSRVRRTRRLLAVLAGVLLLSFAAEALAQAVLSARLEVSYRELFPPGDEPDLDLVNQARDDLTGVRVSVAVAGAETQVDIALELPADSPFTTAVAQGDYSDRPENVVWNLAGGPTIVLADQRLALAWSPPSVTRGEDETALVQLQARPAPGQADDWNQTVDVEMSRPGWTCGQSCEVQLEVSTETTHAVSAVQVEGTVVSQEPQHLTALLSPDSVATVELVPTEPAPSRAVDSFPQPAGAMLASFAAYLWPLAPWVVLYAVLRRWRTALSDAQDDSEADAKADAEADRAGTRVGERFYLLLALGMVPLAVAGVSAALGVVALVGSRILDEPGLFLPFGFGAGVLEAAYAMWAVSALARAGRPGPRVVAVVAVTAVAAVAALALVLTSRPTAPREVFDDPLWVRSWLLSGIGIGFVAAGVFCLGIGRQWRQIVLPMVAGLSVLVVVSVLAMTWSPTAHVAASVISALTTAAMLLVLARIALGDLVRISARSRVTRGVAWALALVALLLVVLPALPVLRPSGADGYLADNATYALRSLVPLALIMTAVIVLRARAAGPAAARPLPWAVVLLLSASLVLRPEVLYAGVPWSFGAGLLLMVLVLFPRSEAWGSDWVPSEQQNTPAVIGAALRRSSRAATAHHLQDTLRKKVARAEVDAQDADATRKVVLQAFGEVPRRPGHAEMRDAFSWAGEHNAWRRAVTAGAAATVVGIVLQFGTLADTVSQISGFFGSRPWGTVAAAALAFRFPLYGLVFGYFFPLIPGATGLVKSLRLLVVLAGSESVLLLVPFGDTATVDAVTIRILQMAVVCLVLGVGADYLTLRKAGSGAEGLGDIYHTSHLVLWGSGVAVAAATALATALAGSAMTLLVERIVPAPPVQQVSTSTSQDPASGVGGAEE